MDLLLGIFLNHKVLSVLGYVEHRYRLLVVF